MLYESHKKPEERPHHLHHYSSGIRKPLDNHLHDKSPQPVDSQAGTNDCGKIGLLMCCACLGLGSQTAWLSYC